MTEQGSNTLVVYDDSIPKTELESLPEWKSAKERVTLTQLEGYSAVKVGSVYLKIADAKEQLSSGVLDRILERVLVPEGSLCVILTNTTLDQLTGVEKQLKLTGYVSVRSDQSRVYAKKDKFEVGESVKLSFSAPAAAQKSVWKVSVNDDEDDDMIDDEALLDEEDLMKPDPESLKVCGTTGKRKACKDCSCGLADELANEDAVSNGPPAKSSCGSCYLGDAFRCATCPYLGMPSFQPGEKVTLTDIMLNPDA